MGNSLAVCTPERTEWLLELKPLVAQDDETLHVNQTEHTQGLSLDSSTAVRQAGLGDSVRGNVDC